VRIERPVELPLSPEIAHNVSIPNMQTDAGSIWMVWLPVLVLVEPMNSIQCLSNHVPQADSGAKYISI
jgi:hypothetical protein